jgi:glycine/D-amino acid oxidase-like deaminating enzyme
VSRVHRRLGRSSAGASGRNDQHAVLVFLDPENRVVFLGRGLDRALRRLSAHLSEQFDQCGRVQSDWRIERDETRSKVQRIEHLAGEFLIGG